MRAAQAMFQQEGVNFGQITYYAYTEVTGGVDWQHDLLQSIRAALPTTPGAVENRVNLFMPTMEFGSGGRTPGPFVATTNYSLVIAGLGIANPGGIPTNVPYLIVHEILHHLGLPHVFEDGLADTGTNTQPANVMDGAFGQGGTYISPHQGIVVRAHPLVR